MTDEAIAQMQHRLEEEWSKRSRGKRLTGVARAELLGVSVPTAKRMFSGTPVDRGTVRIAFENLGMRWRESFLAPCEPSLPAEGGADPAGGGRPPRERVAAPTRLSRRRGVLVALSLGTVAIALAVPVSAPWVGRLAAASLHQSRIERFDRSFAEASEAYHRAEYRLAEETVDGALRLATRMEAGGRIADAMRLKADLAMVRGDLESARSALREALRLRELLGHAHSRPPILEALGVVETRAGNLDVALAHLEGAREGFESAGDWNGVASAERHLGAALLERGDLQGARKVLEAALARAVGNEKPDLAAAIRGQLALVHRDAGELRQARAILEGCLEHWRRRAHPRWVALTELQLATVEARAGDVVLARRLLRRSREAYSSLADAPGADRCDQWLARLSDPSALSASLTSRP